MILPQFNVLFWFPANLCRL